MRKMISQADRRLKQQVLSAVSNRNPKIAACGMPGRPIGPRVTGIQFLKTARVISPRPIVTTAR